MDSRKIVIFFAFVASANCVSMVSEDIYTFVSNNEQCNQSKSVLDSLGMDSCRIPGDRGSTSSYLLCNGIKSVIQDVCNKSNHITLEKVKTLSKFDDSVDPFCTKVRTLNALKLPKNVSDTLNSMKKESCVSLCMTIEAKLNPMCPFLVSYIELKNSSVPKKVNVTNTNLTKGSDAAMKNNIDQTQPVVKVPDPVQKPASNQDTKTDEQSSPIRSENNEQLPQKTSGNEPPNRLPPLYNEPSDLDLNPKPENPDTELHLPSPKNNGKLDENPDEESDRNIGQETNDDGKQTNDEAKQPNEDVKQTNEDTKQTNEDTKQTNEDAKQTNEDIQQSSVDQVNEPDSIANNKAAELEHININVSREPFDEAESSNFFTYFVLISTLCIFFYIAMYNKKKILALMIEGRRSSVKRRPNSAAYSKLDCTLEEAMASGPSTSSSNTLLY